MKPLLYILLIFNFGILRGQNYIDYHNICNSAALQIEKGEYSKAKDSLLIAFKMVDKPFGIDYFNISKCYSQLNKKDSTILFLKLSLSHYRTGGLLIKHKNWFSPILGNEQWEQLLNQKYQSPILDSNQINIRKTLKELAILDQKYRHARREAEIYYPNDTILYAAYGDSMSFYDGYIGNELGKIINEFGWPGDKMINTGTSYACLIHVSDEWFYKMRKKLIEEIKNGNLEPNQFASIEDRVRYRNKQTPLYNAYFFTNNEVTDEIIINCRKIGAALGKVRTLRLFYKI